MNFDIFIHQGNHNHNQCNEHIISITPKGFLIPPYCSSMLFLLPTSPLFSEATKDLLPIMIDCFAFSKILHKWKYKLCTSFALASFTQRK